MTMTTDYNFPPEVQEWIDIVENETYAVCKDQKALIKHVKKCFAKEDIYIDLERLTYYMELCDKYVPFQLFPWQKFVIALHDCTFCRASGLPRWADLFCMLGRGAGKDGTIAIESLLLSSPYNGIPEYDVDICANNEDQAVRPVKDLTGFLENPKHVKKLKKYYKWTIQQITCKSTRSVIKGRTNSPKGKDGLRSGIVIFNEIHQYENYDNINVFTTGLGKKPHPRRSYYTTNGDIREGPLDDLLNDSESVLYGGEKDNGLLCFLCRLDDKKEVHDEKMWTKANPSLPYLPHLQTEIEKEYRDWNKNPARLPAFLTKRMNIVSTANESAVASWESIAATNRPLPDLEGWECTCGIDYSSITDLAAVNLHFRKGEQRYDINKAWLCRDSKDLPRIKAPWQEWIKTDWLDWVDDVEISPELIANYIQAMGRYYNIKSVAIDNYRYGLLSYVLEKIGFSPKKKNLYLVKQTDIIRIFPEIDRCFRLNLFCWDNNPVLRWGTNNTKAVRYGRSKKKGKDEDKDKGSFVYAKIEARSRKTDPFMALVASMAQESESKDHKKIRQVKVLTFGG